MSGYWLMNNCFHDFGQSQAVKFGGFFWWGWGERHVCVPVFNHSEV